MGTYCRTHGCLKAECEPSWLCGECGAASASPDHCCGAESRSGPQQGNPTPALRSAGRSAHSALVPFAPDPDLVGNAEGNKRIAAKDRAAAHDALHRAHNGSRDD